MHLDEDDDTCALRAQRAVHKQLVDDVELMAFNAGYRSIDTPNPAPDAVLSSVELPSPAQSDAQSESDDGGTCGGGY